MLHTGVIVKSTQGADKLDSLFIGQPEIWMRVFSDGYVTRKINHFSVPILLKYRFAAFFMLRQVLCWHSELKDTMNSKIPWLMKTI